MPARLPLLVFILAFASPLAAAPRDLVSPSPGLRGAQCLDPATVRAFTPIDNRQVIIDAGRRLYRLELTPSCLNFYSTDVIGFRGDPVSNRVCGTSFDAVLVRGFPCRIERMQAISRAEYKQGLIERDEYRRAQRAERRARREQAR